MLKWTHGHAMDTLCEWRNDETMEKPVGDLVKDMDSDGYSENCMEKYSKLEILDRYFNQRYLS
ncbi:hypothetical protein KAI60_03830 [Candidatus Bathyarchaeota archaeon]|nr:hypothetical protein [Candidatus Bathyarchaeota archaeon]